MLGVGALSENKHKVVKVLTSLQFSMCFFSPSTVFLLTLLHFGQVTLPLATICSCQRSSWLPGERGRMTGGERVSLLTHEQQELVSLSHLEGTREAPSWWRGWGVSGPRWLEPSRPRQHRLHPNLEYARLYTYIQVSVTSSSRKTSDFLIN